MLQKSLVKGVGERTTAPSELMGAQGRSLRHSVRQAPPRLGAVGSMWWRRAILSGRDEPVVVVREEGLRVVVRKKV